MTQFRAADGWSRLRIRGEACRGDGGGGRLVEADDRWVLKIVRCTRGASVQINPVHGRKTKKIKNVFIFRNISPKRQALLFLVPSQVWPTEGSQPLPCAGPATHFLSVCRDF